MMKHKLAIAIGTLSVALVATYIVSVSAKSQDTPVQNTAMQKSSGSYKLIWHDEFEGKNGSLPDKSKWGFANRVQNHWGKWIGNSNKTVFLRNGHLVCRAIPNTINRADTALMLTGAVSTKGKFAFKYGRFLVRMRTNLQKGNFPAAWLWPVDNGNPYRYGEIDVFESFGDNAVAQQTVHSHRSAVLKKRVAKNEFKTKTTINRWHIYGIEWTPTSLSFLIDGEVVGTYYKDNDAELLKDGQWTFDRPFYIILNQSVGDGNWFTPDVTKTYETEFDWVRVYQLSK